MYVKMVCGKHTSIIEIIKNIKFMFKYGKYNFISGKDKYREIKDKLKKETCFKYYNKKFYLLEINTQPGMTNLSLVPEIASYKGIEFPELIKEIVKDASINK